jgi:hypothetical protein
MTNRQNPAGKLDAPCAAHTPRSAVLFAVLAILIVILGAADLSVLVYDVAGSGWEQGWRQWEQQQQRWFGPPPVFPPGN